MRQRFIHNINPEQMLHIDGREYQYNTIDDEGWTYWKELGKGNDLGLKLLEIYELSSDSLLLTFHTGYSIIIPRAEHDSPLLDLGV